MGLFPSPTGVKYYESIVLLQLHMHVLPWFPSPTGVKYYELFYHASIIVCWIMVSVPNRG